MREATQKEHNVKVMDAARAIALDHSNGPATGTIDEAVVLTALAALTEADPDNDDLYRDAAEQVRAARSAGVEELHSGSVFLRPGEVTTTQLRYRSEMADIFTDLAIDVGLREHRKLVPAG